MENNSTKESKMEDSQEKIPTERKKTLESILWTYPE